MSLNLSTFIKLPGSQPVPGVFTPKPNDEPDVPADEPAVVADGPKGGKVGDDMEPNREKDGNVENQEIKEKIGGDTSDKEPPVELPFSKIDMDVYLSNIGVQVNKSKQ